MKWIKIAVPVLFLFLLMLPGWKCSGADKTDCKQKIKEIRAMIDTTIMDYGDYEVMLPPSMYCPGDFIRYVFAVPKDNMVGTNELDNAITLLEFKNDEELEHHTVKKDFMEMVTGPFEFRFLPVWSDKDIAYSQSKGFLLVNIPDKKVGIHTISPGMYMGNIENLAVLDASKKTFVFEIDKPFAKVQGFKKLLQVIRFENDTFTVLAEHPAGIKTSAYTEPWFAYQKKIFVYNDSTTKLEVFDENFKPVTHPIAEAFNKNQVGFRCMQETAIHPTLPIALIVEQGKWPKKEQLSKFDSLPPKERNKATDVIYDEAERLTLYLFRWNESDEKKRFTPLISKAGSIWNSYNPANNYSDFTFSPDGKWLVFRDKSMRGNDLQSSDNPIFVAVPISEKNPLYLGKPIKLGNAMRGDAIGPTGTAWTINPISFVMCDGSAIYRWNLDRYRTLSMQKVKMPPNTPDPFTKKGE
jgi:hypothetical protein